MMSKAMAPGIESARVEIFSGARPLDDWYHFSRLPTHAAKLKRIHEEGRSFVKTELGWLMAAPGGFQRP